MKHLLLVIYKGLQQIRLSLKSSHKLITVKQRVGNRYMNVFAVTFILSIFGNWMVFQKQKEIEDKYLEYRKKVETQIISKQSEVV